MRLELECEAVLGAAIEVHRTLGPGLLESAYTRCLALELEARGIPHAVQVPIPLTYRDVVIEPAYRADLIVWNCIVLEVKCVQRLEPIHHAQLLTYLRLTKLSVGLLLNFHAPTLKQGMKRIVL